MDETAAGSLFEKGEEVGKTVEIQGEPFTVTGIIKKVEEFEPVINSIEEYNTYYSSSGGVVLMPSAAWPVVVSV